MIPKNKKTFDYKEFKISRHITIACEVYETRSSWGHLAYLYIDGRNVDDAKITYYNRTWEAFQYESILLNLINNTKELNDKDKREARLFVEKMAGRERDRANKDFRSLAMVMKMGEVLTDDKKSANDWKARMLKAGLENKGLIMPDDWNKLSEEDKEARLNKVIEEFNNS